MAEEDISDFSFSFADKYTLRLHFSFEADETVRRLLEQDKLDAFSYAFYSIIGLLLSVHMGNLATKSISRCRERKI